MPSVPPGNAAGAPRARPESSVTVSVTRRVEPTRIQEATRWAQQGMDLAGSFPGFLGSGWVRATADSLSWHMLYRFATSELLDAWEGSAERAHWLIDGHDLILDARVEKRTGIEGWFDSPSSDDVEAASAFQPPRWKQAVSIGLGFLPSNLADPWLARCGDHAKNSGDHPRDGAGDDVPGDAVGHPGPPPLAESPAEVLWFLIGH